MYNALALQLCQILNEMSTQTPLFSVDASKDYSRSHILTLKETLTIILGMAGGSLNRELYNHFKYTSVISIGPHLTPMLFPGLFGRKIP